MWIVDSESLTSLHIGCFFLGLFFFWWAIIWIIPSNFHCFSLELSLVLKFRTIIFHASWIFTFIAYYLIFLILFLATFVILLEVSFLEEVSKFSCHHGNVFFVVWTFFLFFFFFFRITILQDRRFKNNRYFLVSILTVVIILHCDLICHEWTNQLFQR